MVNPKYKKFVTHENGKRVLYLQLLKALYGCVQSALLWYDLFTNTLKNDGFELNPYDACVANKIVNGKQCTIVWYVDDNKISHVEEAVVTKVVKMIEKRFGNLLSAALICRYLVYFELPQLYSIPSPAIL
jgi:hypothetical protein